MHRKLVLGLALTLGFAFTASAWIPEAEAPQVRPSAEDLGLANPDTSAEALDALLARRDARVVLVQLAGDPEADLAARGWAIVGLTRLPAGADTDAALDELRDSDGNPVLVRNWAAAARLERIEDFDELANYGRFVQAYPSLERPFGMAIEAGIHDIKSPEVLIRLMANHSQLTQIVAPRILEMPDRSLVRAMYTATDDRTRQTAAALVGSKASRGNPKVLADMTVELLAFDGGEPPWMGGALYVPGLQWTGPQAKALISELVRWSLFCADRPEFQRERGQITNNLASVGLLRKAGFDNGIPNDPAQMVQAYRNTMGNSAARSMLEELQLADDSRFAVKR